jgi:hypothetical protein
VPPVITVNVRVETVPMGNLLCADPLRFMRQCHANFPCPDARGSCSTPSMRLLPLCHGAFFLVGGLWPVVHLESFERITGRKVDGWLVKTMGGVLAVIGASLLAGASQPASRSERILGAGSAAALALADVVYGGSGRISRIYLVDGAIESTFVLAWLQTR